MTQGFALTGLYPRRESLVKASWNADKGLVAPHELDTEYLAATSELVSLQQELGAQSVTDGNLTWQDQFRALVEASPGLEVGGVTRLFETNRFYRQPILRGAPTLDDAKLAEFFRLDGTATTLSKRAVLPSPYWFSRWTRVQNEQSPDTAAHAIAEYVNQVAQWLVGRGYREIVFNESLLFYEKNPNLALAKDLLDQAVDDVRAQTIVNFANGDASRHLDWLAKVPSWGVGVDFVETNVARVANAPQGLNLQAGVVNAQESLIESATEVQALVSNVLKAFAPSSLTLTHTGDLETVPTPVAEQKLRALRQATQPEVVA